MTTDERLKFAELLRTAADAFPSFVLDANVLRAYQRVLQAVPLRILEIVRDRILSGVAGTNYFPSAPKWLDLANEVRLEEMEARAAHLPDGDRGFGPEFFCASCEDTGWILVAADTGAPVTGVARCGSHAGKRVVRCPCRATNPAYRRRHPRAPERYEAPNAQLARRRTPAAPSSNRGRGSAAGDWE